jgi:hypothetical protein
LNIPFLRIVWVYCKKHDEIEQAPAQALMVQVSRPLSNLFKLPLPFVLMVSSI